MDVQNSQSAAEAEQTIESLEHQAGVDRDLIETLQLEIQLDREKIANLETALKTARRIGTAMGILMMSEKLTEEQAFELLRQTSQRRQRKLRDLAQTVVDTGTIEQ